VPSLIAVNKLLVWPEELQHVALEFLDQLHKLFENLTNMS